MPHSARKKVKAPMAAMYRYTGKVHLPADPGWRQFARERPITILASSPDGLFQSLIQQAVSSCMEGLSPDDASTMTFGLLLNLVQGFPMEIRQALVEGVAAGMAMTMFVRKNEETGQDEIIADLSKQVDSFYEVHPDEVEDDAEDSDLALPDASGFQARPSGLIVPR